MGTKGTKSARQVAFEVLEKFDRDRTDSQKTLHEKIHEANRKGRATDIVYGAIRNRMTIDMVISRFSGLSKDRIRPKLLNILRVAVFELIYVPETSDYAIVNEAVNLAHSAAGKKDANFVNAVMRKITRVIFQRNASLKRVSLTRCIPTDHTSGCEFIDDLLPDPESDGNSYLSKAFSLPKWVVGEWLDDFGFEKTRDICLASNRRPGIYLQPNTLKISEQEFASLLMSGGIKFEIVAKGKMFRLRSNKAIVTLPGYAEGFFTVQDPTAANVAMFFAPKTGWTVLDLCAAPGGKTIRLAQVMRGKGQIYATDKNSDRLKMVDDNCDRLGITSVKTFAYDELDKIISESGKFDAVLLDVPCSNTGVMARRPEVRLKVTPKKLESLAKAQMELLEKTSDMLKEGGKLCYSTCSISNTENSDLVKTFLKKHRGFKLGEEKLTLPYISPDKSFDYDGGYAAILEK